MSETPILFRSKPSTIEAVQWTGDNFHALVTFASDKVADDGDVLYLHAGADGAQDWVPVPVGHWLVSQPGDRSDIWPVDPDYFAAKYEPAENGSSEPLQ